MNIGFVSFFAFRPHVEHIYALSKIIREAGHEVFFLSCDSALSTCYRRELTKSSMLIECAKCTIGGIRSYPVSRIDSARKFKIPNVADRNIDYSIWGHSSACTILRAESEADKHTAEFLGLRKKLSDAAFKSFQITREWIKTRDLDSIVCFNGRMDATRGVLEAAKLDGIRFLSVERTWGDGLLLLPDSDCLGLKEIHRMVQKFRVYPLSEEQAIKAAKIVTSRFLKKNKTEWRAYNPNSVDREWPIKEAQKKVLILPSSFNEYDGHPEWKMKWRDQFDAFNNVIKDLSLPIESFVMRGHPGWSQSIGATGGDKIESHYLKWAEAKGVHYIPGSSNISTPNLISQADIIILNGGSAAIEAGLLGKRVISLVETTYKYAGFVINYLSTEDKSNLLQLDHNEPSEIIRLTLRFLYSWGFRVMQFTNEIHAINAINYKYYSELDANKVIKILLDGELSPDDPLCAENWEEEIEVIKLVLNGEWEKIDSYPIELTKGIETKFQRKAAFRFIDILRKVSPPGDR